MKFNYCVWLIPNIKNVWSKYVYGFHPHISIKTNLEKKEAIEYYKTYIPDSINYLCPLTSESFNMNVSEDGSIFTVSSPIDIPIVDRHYLLFAFKAKNHGSIKGGRKSWE